MKTNNSYCFAQNNRSLTKSSPNRVKSEPPPINPTLFTPDGYNITDNMSDPKREMYNAEGNNRKFIFERRMISVAQTSVNQKEYRWPSRTDESEVGFHFDTIMGKLFNNRNIERTTQQFMGLTFENGMPMMIVFNRIMSTADRKTQAFSIQSLSEGVEEFDTVEFYIINEVA
jgi:hypothetical protein